MRVGGYRFCVNDNADVFTKEFGNVLSGRELEGMQDPDDVGGRCVSLASWQVPCGTAPTRRNTTFFY